jgi:hypothetical protein
MTNHRLPGDAYLDGVSCPTTKSCFAVGYDSTRDGFSVTGVVEHWNGRGSWSIMIGTPSPTNDTALDGVSCPSPTNCFAVGYANESFIEHWGGRGSWTIMSSPNPGVESVLVGVSCPNTTTCVAVGSSIGFTDYGKSVVEQWNGSSWSLLPGLSPPIHSGLTGVSCPRTNSCVAVGEQPRNGDHYKTLVERYA